MKDASLKLKIEDDNESVLWLYFVPMESAIHYNGSVLQVKYHRFTKADGVYYEINILGYNRFFVKWGALNRYELVKSADLSFIPEDLVLVVSDLLEQAD